MKKILEKPYEIDVGRKFKSGRHKIWIRIKSWVSIVPAVLCTYTAAKIIDSTCIDPIKTVPIALTLITLGFTLSDALIKKNSANNRWLINKEVECFENIIDSCEFYYLLIEEYESYKIDFKDLFGIQRVEFIKTLVVSQRSIENYKNYLTGYDRSEEILKKLSDLIDDVINCTDNYEKLKNDLKKIIDLSYQLINLSPYIYSDVNKKEIDRKTQEVLKGCD
ncbi:MAG: hypothetical protein [Caudoviricetes sp.]|nr:MAG: hypothetical protein [Caudoviricetes sp.]